MREALTNIAEEWQAIKRLGSPVCYWLELVGPALDKYALTNYVFTSELNIDPLLMTMRSLVGSNIDLSSLGWASYLTAQDLFIPKWPVLVHVAAGSIARLLAAPYLP